MIEEKIVVIKEAKKEPGIRLRTKVTKNSFSEELDYKNVYLESFNAKGKVLEAFRIERELLPDLQKGIKEFCDNKAGKKKKTMVAARIVS